MSDAAPPVEVEVEGPVVRVWLNRPERRNAFDDVTATRLLDAFEGLGQRAGARVVVLGGRGETFCAGGDLGWMRRVAGYSAVQNLEDAAGFQRAFDAIDRCPLPVVARVHGAAFGGGAGLVAVSDVAVAADGTRLGFPEVRLGLVPGVVGPYVLDRIGVGQARRLFLTGETLEAEEARALGLLHRVVPAGDLDAAVDEVVRQVLAGGPDALGRTKAFVRALARTTDEDARAALARRAIAEARASDDGREGTTAFLEKRKPRWRT